MEVMSARWMVGRLVGWWFGLYYLPKMVGSYNSMLLLEHLFYHGNLF